jgi:signal transduction histidine kinase
MQHCFQQPATYLILFLFWISLGVSHANPYTSIQTISTATHSTVKDTGKYPPSFRVFQTVELPHDASTIASTSSWYSFIFELENNPQQNLALYLPLINMNASIYLNQKMIGASGSFQEPMSRFWHTPVLFYLPISSLKQGKNTIHIRLKATAPNDLTQLGKVYLGSVDDVYPMYADDYFASYTIHLMSLSAALFLGFITLYLWWLQKFDEYLYFSLACLTWAVSSLNIVIHQPPMSSFMWEWLIHSTLSWIPFFVLLFIYRILHLTSQKIETSLWFINTIFTVALLFVPHHYFFPAANSWHLIALLTGLYAVFLVLKSYIQHKAQTTLILGLGFMTVGLFAAHDYLVVIHVFDGETRFLLDYSMPLLLLAIAIVLIHRFVDARKGLEQANITLEQRVFDAEAEIKASYAIISAMETAEAVDNERTRIFADLHDDLGAKLLSLVYKSETPEQRKLAKQAMDGLREIVKQTPTETYAQSRPISGWRMECELRAKEHGILLHWHQRHLSNQQEISTVIAIQLPHVLREAFSNALKHGDRKDIHINIQKRFNQLIVKIRNGGKLFCDTYKNGSGRYNMQRRIQHMQGTIRWKGCKQGGCRVTCVVPLNGQSE